MRTRLRVVRTPSPASDSPASEFEPPLGTPGDDLVAIAEQFVCELERAVNELWAHRARGQLTGVEIPALKAVGALHLPFRVDPVAQTGTS